jgi:hypothetical protein
MKKISFITLTADVRSAGWHRTSPVAFSPRFTVSFERWASAAAPTCPDVISNVDARPELVDAGQGPVVVRLQLVEFGAELEFVDGAPLDAAAPGGRQRLRNDAVVEESLSLKEIQTFSLIGNVIFFTATQFREVTRSSRCFFDVSSKRLMQ